MTKSAEALCGAAISAAFDHPVNDVCSCLDALGTELDMASNTASKFASTLMLRSANRTTGSPLRATASDLRTSTARHAAVATELAAGTAIAVGGSGLSRRRSMQAEAVGPTSSIRDRTVALQNRSLTWEFAISFVELSLQDCADPAYGQICTA